MNDDLAARLAEQGDIPEPLFELDPLVGPDIIGLFEGYGGLTMAAAATLGGKLVGYSEIEPAACRLLAHHHPGVPNYGDITTVDWSAIPRSGRPLVLAGGFPCLPAGTLVDAGDDGLRPIETLRVGDLVMTHNRRRRPVTSVMRREAEDVLTVSAMGAPAFRVTAEHPFYVRRKTQVWNNAARRYERAWATPEWVAAGELDKTCFLGMPIDTTGPEPYLGVLAYIVGRWLGDGWITDHLRTSRVPTGQRGSRVKSRVHKAIICAAYDEADDLAQAIAAAGLHATRAPDRTVVKFHISSESFVKVLRPFGRGAAGKRIPGRMFTAPLSEQAAFLQGWLDADGNQQSAGAWRGGTISEQLAHAMSRIARTVHGVATSVHYTPRPATCQIEGRTVNQQSSFEVVIPPRNRESFVAHGYAWVPVRSVTPAVPCEVFNVSVDEDESYTAWGYAVHNCQDVSSAGRRRGMHPDTRSGLWAHMSYAIDQLRPDLVIIENVRGLLSADAACDLESCPWCVGDDEGRPLRALGAVCGDLADLGFDASWCGLRAADVGAPHGRFRIFITAWPAAGDANVRDRNRWATAGLEREAGPTTGSVANPSGVGWGEGWPESARFVGGSDASVGGDVAPADADGIGSARAGCSRPGRAGSTHHDLAAPNADGDAVRKQPVSVGRGGGEAVAEHPVLDWGDYGPAVERWELILGRAAPAPTMTGSRGGQQLAPRFVEWMMGLPDGWVTAVPGLRRNEQLKALGNGVCPQQAEAALRWLLAADRSAVAA